MKYLHLCAYGPENKFWQAAYLQIARHIDGDFNIILSTDRLEVFEELSDRIILEEITSDDIKCWSMDGAYHYRTKSRSFARACEKYLSSDVDRILHLDTDIIVSTSSIERCFNKISKKSIVMFRCEGKISSKPRFSAYWNHIEDPARYSMWGSALIGLCKENAFLLNEADLKLKSWIGKIESHTIEQFALCYSATQAGIRIKKGILIYTHFSTSRRTKFAVNVLNEIFSEPRDHWWDLCRERSPVQNPILRALSYNIGRLRN